MAQFQISSESVECSLPEVLTTAGGNRHSCELTEVKTGLYLSGVLDHCVHVLSLEPRSLQGHWRSVTTLAQLTRRVPFTVQTNASTSPSETAVLSVQLLLRWGGTWPPPFRDVSQALPAVTHGRPPLIGQPPDEAGRGETLLSVFSLQPLFVEWIGLNPVCPSVCVCLPERDGGFGWEAFQSPPSAGRAGWVTSAAQWFLHRL